MGHQSSKHHHRRTSIPSQPTNIAPTKLVSTRSDSAVAVRRHDLSTFAVIAVIFNPVQYKSRYNHYRNFEAHMAQSGVNLYTIECVFESAARFGLPQQAFEMTRPGNPQHIQVVAPSIMWMKENLINIAIRYLPPKVEYIAWIDADVEFDHRDWPHRTIDELQRYPIVQLFELSYFLGPGGKSDVLRRDYSFGYSIRHNKPINPQRSNDWYAHPGYAWAMRRSAMASIGGLLDFCIIGSGDLHFAFALLNRIEDTIRPGLHPDYRRLAITWGERVAKLAQNGANVGYVPVNLWHHWHGDRQDRSYVDRWAILEKHQFSPIQDLEKNDDTGLIRLTDTARSGRRDTIARIDALERDIVAYFRSRNEDSNAKSVPKHNPPPATKKPAIPSRGQTHHRGGFKPSTTSSSHWKGSRGPHIWTSGPAGTHVDDCNPYSDHCTCPGHHHHADNHDCPCSPNHMDDQHCWDGSEHDHHDHDHHDHDHHSGSCFPSDDHHDHHEGDHSSYDYGHHGGGDNDHSFGGGGTDHTDYGGPGSFY